MNLELTPRNKRFRERLIHTYPAISAQKALIMTEVFKRHESLPTVVKVAIAFREVLEKMDIEIYEDDLIVGNQADGFRTCPLSPNVNTWYIDELDLFEKRVDTRFTMTEANKEIFRCVVPYWQGKTVNDATNALVDENLSNALKTMAFTGSPSATKGLGHWLVGFEKVLNQGLRPVKEQAEKKLGEIAYWDAEGIEKIPFYKAVIEVIEGARHFATRYAELAAEMAQKAEGKRKAELLEISEICKRVPYERPETFKEALQTVFFIQLMAQIETDATGHSMGRLDKMLYPFYKRDIEAGILTKEEAEEWLDNLWLKIGSIIQAWNEQDTQHWGGHPISQAVTLGGQDEQGNDDTNELSYMMLETTARVHMAQPSVCARVNRNTPDEFLMKIAEVIRVGLGMPAVYNDDIAMESLTRQGIPLELARRDYAVIGCVEMGIEGKMCNCANCGYVNLGKAVELTLNDGMDPRTGIQVGLHTGLYFANFESFVEAYYKQLHYLLAQLAAHVNIVDYMNAQYAPLPFISTLIEDCVERGKEVHDGGAIYNYDGMQGAGLADATDSLCVIKKLIFEQKVCTFDELRAALAADFEGYEELRLKAIKDVPKYGNNIPEVDEIAQGIVKHFGVSAESFRSPRGGKFLAGLYTNSANVSMGLYCGALPNGRKAYQPLADACSPSHNVEKFGPTQATLSVASLDHQQITNGTQYNQKYHPSSLAGEKGLRALCDIIRTYFAAGGYHIQFNVVSAEVLKEAQKDPQSYRDLVVRVAGYTAFFTDLSNALQDDIIGRTELGFH